MTVAHSAPVDIESLRAAIRAEYAAVAQHPDQGFHFHTGARLAAILGYPEEWIAALPPTVVESMAGTGNPFAFGELDPSPGYRSLLVETLGQLGVEDADASLG